MDVRLILHAKQQIRRVIIPFEYPSLENIAHPLSGMLRPVCPERQSQRGGVHLA